MLEMHSGLKADLRMDGGHEDHSHAFDFAHFLEKRVDHECLRYQGQLRWQLGVTIRLNISYCIKTKGSDTSYNNIRTSSPCQIS